MRNVTDKETILTPEAGSRKPEIPIRYLVSGIRNLFAMAFLFLVCIGYAQDPQTLVKEANKAYSEGLYTDAREAYQQVTDAGWESPILYYNLGNACFKLNDYPHAILWYERALRLDPGNEDILYNLNVANSKIADRIEPLPTLFYVRWYQGLVGLFSVTAWAVQTIIYFILTLISALLYLYTRHILLRKSGFWGGILFLALTFLTLLFSVSGSHHVRNVREAILFEPTITVKSSPDAKGVDLFPLHEGTRVQLIDQIGTWYEIRIANGSVGWLPAEALEEI